LSQLQKKLSRQIFWGHSEVIIFGKERVGQGIQEDMDFLLRASQPRERSFVYVAKGTGKQILQLHSTLERNTSEVLREMSNTKTSYTTTLAELSKMLNDEGKAAILPWVEQLPPLDASKPDLTVGYINGSALLRQGKLTGVADDKITRGILWINNKMDNAVITVHPKESKGTVSAHLQHSRTRLTPFIENGKWKMKITVSCKSDLIQNTTKLNILQNEQTLKQIESDIVENINSRISLAVYKAQKVYKTDIFDFGNEFHQHYPAEWAQHKDDWYERFQTIEVVIETKVSVARPGMFNSPNM
jgi:spore germination protein KC